MSNLKHTPEDYFEKVKCKNCKEWRFESCESACKEECYLEFLENNFTEMLEALISLAKQLDDLGGDGLTLENEMKFTHYAGIIEHATGLPIEEVLK